MQTQARINSREEQQCSLGIAALLDQKDALIQRYGERMETQKKAEALKQAILAEWDKDEEPSRVKVTMETGDDDTEMDTTIAEQGALPEACGRGEQQIYDRLVAFELNPIQWKFEALSYLATITGRNQRMREKGEETQTVQQVYPKLWKYLELMSVLTRYEVATGKDDLTAPVADRFAAAQKVHRT